MVLQGLIIAIAGLIRLIRLYIAAKCLYGRYLEQHPVHFLCLCQVGLQWQLVPQHWAEVALVHRHDGVADVVMMSGEDGRPLVAGA